MVRCRSSAPRRPRGIPGHVRAVAQLRPARGRSRLAHSHPPVCTRAHARRRVGDHAHLSNVDLQVRQVVLARSAGAHVGLGVLCRKRRKRGRRPGVRGSTGGRRFKNAEHGAACFAGEVDDFIYTRINNPTVRELEQTLAILEEGAETICTSSGMAAVNVVFFGLLSKVRSCALARALWAHRVH